ncbi:MAG: FkbM family methyltransferase [Alphaproteobacteria bacterium]
MAKPLINAARLAESRFLETGLAKAFDAAPVGLIDVGARWGVDELFRLTPSLFHPIAVEPDLEEAARIATREHDAGWNGFDLCTSALGARQGQGRLNLLKRANNSSLYPVDPRTARRYHLAGFELVRTMDVALRPLDDVVFDDFKALEHAGEAIKLDVQGAEADILTGGRKTLRERTVCLICEVHFLPAYEGIALFSEVEREARKLGFSFYGFLDFQHRSTKRLDKRQHRGLERMMQADAVFFRDPFDEANAGMGHRKSGVLLLLALLLGYYDFCLELTELLKPEDRPAVQNAIRTLAQIDDIADQAEIQALARAAAESASEAHIALARLVDRRRDLTTVHDIMPAPKA